ncbi:unnamed protein product [Phytomonas sp. EM1]|nr:unnamed protein product [Phytomonas sp. EM1]|eukprot:CCW64110.1 unnamed protein product [Phytomonas sp. isolate EM1]
MRFTFKALRNTINSSRGASGYYPRFRPRRLVMPVDTNDVHSPRRFGNPLHQKHIEQVNLRRSVERQGAIKLSSVPAERTVGDAFRLMLQTCESNGFFESSKNFTPPSLVLLERHLQEWEHLQQQMFNEKVDSGTNASTSPPSLCGISSSSATSSLSVREIDRMWSLLDRTPLNAPVHGLLALRGKALVEGVIARTSYALFPRLRSKHLQQLLHETAGLLPCGRVATRLGFADLAGVDGEIGMWRELNVLQQRFDIARRKAAAHLQRVEKGVAAQRRWYWKAVLRAASGRLKMFPVVPGDLFPRMEWIRSFVFAFVAFLEMAERAADSNVKVTPLILKLFCAQLGEFAHTRHLLNSARTCMAFEETHSHRLGLDASKNEDALRRFRDLTEAIRREVSGHLHRSPEELHVLNAKSHPLNDRADRRREQFESSGGAVATQSLRDDIFDAYEIERHRRDAPPVVLHALRTTNALKEAQLILKYAPGIAPSIRRALIDVDPIIRRTVEVHETNNYATLHNTQQYRQVEYTVCRLYAGTQAIGEGKGETLMEAINEAAQHTVFNYYVRGVVPTEVLEGKNSPTGDGDPESMRDTSKVSDGEARVSGTVRIRKVKSEEEIIF